MRATAAVVATLLASGIAAGIGSGLALAIRPVENPPRKPAPEIAIPEGFEFLPVESPGQVAIARKGDVYFVVQDASVRLAADADPVTAARDLLPGPGDTKGSWETIGAAQAIRFVRHAGDVHWVGVIGSRGPAAARIALCQIGVGLKKEASEARERAVDACLEALERLGGLRAPEQPTLPFTPPKGFLRGVAPDGSIYLGHRDDLALFVSDVPHALEVTRDLVKMTEVMDANFGKGRFHLTALTVEPVAGVDAVQFAGKMNLHPFGELVQSGYAIPRGERTLLVSVWRGDAVTPEVEAVAREVAATTQGVAAAPGAKSQAAAPGSPPAADADKDGDGWKAALVLGALVAASVLLSVVFAFSSRRGRSRRRGDRS